ncbi:hypothetical protein IE077_000869 [Cardiosporidium cionae]|uniref:Succinate dehydrogenase assembly factor 4, mitochondrial n=1 Tax=Cardiosporidium cionae TaxID=476202 RepID=A0ABQ7J6A7_9APIC|nr:hypothetical protein IE077_000869 [Cardiosporidium cionae]|eukprot:KAF8819536.1 hypothetical protein IE077_000869 [Cardiosporidium cionae]
MPGFNKNVRSALISAIKIWYPCKTSLSCEINNVSSRGRPFLLTKLCSDRFFDSRMQTEKLFCRGRTFTAERSTAEKTPEPATGDSIEVNNAKLIQNDAPSLAEHGDISSCEKSSSFTAPQLQVAEEASGNVDHEDSSQNSRVSTNSVDSGGNPVNSEKMETKVIFPTDSKVEEQMRDINSEGIDATEDQCSEFGEYGFRYKGQEPTKYGDWAHKGRVSDF